MKSHWFYIQVIGSALKAQNLDKMKVSDTPKVRTRKVKEHNSLGSLCYCGGEGLVHQGGDSIQRHGNLLGLLHDVCYHVILPLN